MEIETKLGTLKARLINFKHYPGISFGIKVGTEWLEIGLIEVNQNPYDEPKLKAHVWPGLGDEDPVDFEWTEKDIADAREAYASGQ